MVIIVSASHSDPRRSTGHPHSNYPYPAVNSSASTVKLKLEINTVFAGQQHTRGWPFPCLSRFSATNAHAGAHSLVGVSRTLPHECQEHQPTILVLRCRARHLTLSHMDLHECLISTYEDLHAQTVFSMGLWPY